MTLKKNCLRVDYDWALTRGMRKLAGSPFYLSALSLPPSLSLARARTLSLSLSLSLTLSLSGRVKTRHPGPALAPPSGRVAPEDRHGCRSLAETDASPV
jgi:hypothetical protein